MSRQRVDQLYCTHCTYATSALHRREGASGDQVFEESTRAGSIPREKSHDVYSRFGSNLLFHVPGDMPAEEMIKCDVRSLPWRRLVYLPSVGGYRLLAQVCFRQKDTRGRPGASFSHVLIQDLKEFPTAWSALDCLKLWGSEKWVIEEQQDLRHDLSPIPDLRDFDPEFKSLINDRLLLNFLKGPAGAEFRDRERIIPKRWQNTSPEARQKLLAYLLQAVLNLDFERRESLFVVVEPSVAALLFYGIIRLLPARGIAEKLTISTYQSHHDRLTTTLAATCFHDPVTTDLPNDWYTLQARGVACNTFKSDRQTPLKKSGHFGAGMVARLVSDGMDAIDVFLADCDRMGIGTAEELEGLAAIKGQVANLLKSQSPEQRALLERSLPRASGLRALLREKLAVVLNQLSEAGQLSKWVENAPEALLVLRLFTEPGAAEHGTQLDPLIQAIISCWREPSAGVLLNDSSIPRGHKVDFIFRFVNANLALPRDSKILFFFPEAPCRRDNILEDVLLRLDGERLQQFVLNTFNACSTDICFCELLQKLATISASPERDQAFTALFQQLSAQVPEGDERKQMLNAALAEKAVRNKMKTWEADQILSNHLVAMLKSLEKSPGRLDQRLGVLEDLKQFVPKYKSRIRQWRIVSNQLKELQRLNSVAASFLQKVMGQGGALEKDEAAGNLISAAKEALSSESGSSVSRAEKITRFVSEVLGEDGLPEDFQTRCETVFAGADWPSRPSRQLDLSTLYTPQRAIVGAIAVISLVLLVSAWRWIGSR